MPMRGYAVGRSLSTLPGISGSPQDEAAMKQSIAFARRAAMMKAIANPVHGGGSSTGSGSSAPQFTANDLAKLATPLSGGSGTGGDGGWGTGDAGAAPAASSSSGSGGDGGSGGTALTQTPTGYAAGYLPADLSMVAYQHPEILAGDVLKSMGIKDPVLASMLAANGGFAALAAFLSGGNGATGPSDADVINYMGNYFKHESTVGGSTPDTQALVDAILNAGSNPSGAIANYLGLSGSAPDATKLNDVTTLVNNTVMNALNDQNPYTQKATENYLAGLASQYASDEAHGKSVPDYGTYLKQHGLGSWF